MLFELLAKKELLATYYVKIICKTQQNSSLLLMMLHFMPVAECRVLLMKNAEEIMVPLRNLLEVTLSAKHLYNTISGEVL